MHFRNSMLSNICQLKVTHFPATFETPFQQRLRPMYPMLKFLTITGASGFLLAVVTVADSQNPVPYDGQSQDVVTAFKPSLGVVIGILSVMFSLTFIILVYAKFCHGAATMRNFRHDLIFNGGLSRTRSQLSGIDKKVIESLPFFRFSALKGSKEGLECAVCLSKFEDVEMLRLLPICKHAFHIACIDQWLEKHSTCPLCRCKISSTDPQVFAYSNSLRYLQSESEDYRADSNMEIFIEREENHESERLGLSSRFGIGSSFGKSAKGDKESLIDQEINDEGLQKLHKFNHKIIVSDVVFRNRWSSVSSSDLMFLNSELLSATISDRFVLKASNNLHGGNGIEEAEQGISRNRTGLLTDEKSGRRSMSEITGPPRLQGVIIHKNETNEGVEEERRRKIWFPIAQKTLRWFANRENRTEHNTKEKHKTRFGSLRMSESGNV